MNQERKKSTSFEELKSTLTLSLICSIEKQEVLSLDINSYPFLKRFHRKFDRIREDSVSMYYDICQIYPFFKQELGDTGFHLSKDKILFSYFAAAIDPRKRAIMFLEILRKHKLLGRN